MLSQFFRQKKYGNLHGVLTYIPDVLTQTQNLEESTPRTAEINGAKRSACLVQTLVHAFEPKAHRKRGFEGK